MNKKYKLLTITLFVFFSGILVTISNMTKSGNVNCSGTLQMNSPGDQEFLFNGTISVVIRPGTESIISIFGTSVSARQPSPINTHLVNRDIKFYLFFTQINKGRGTSPKTKVLRYLRTVSLLFS
ncbi:hypothetical protein LWT79_24570, partial [Enterobacter hormaechei]|nr:hypothetical protein [Enterobacter hormaechei]